METIKQTRHIVMNEGSLFLIMEKISKEIWWMEMKNFYLMNGNNRKWMSCYENGHKWQCKNKYAGIDNNHHKKDDADWISEWKNWHSYLKKNEYIKHIFEEENGQFFITNYNFFIQITMSPGLQWQKSRKKNFIKWWKTDFTVTMAWSPYSSNE